MRFPRTRCVKPLLEELERRDAPAILTVGPGQTYATLGAAAAAAQNGDTVRITATTFNDADAYAVWNDDNLIIEGMGATRTILDATGFNLPNRKGIFTITGDNVTVRNIEFRGAHDSAGADRNWAGIRQEGTSLTVSNCYFHDNDDGILTGADASSDIVVEFSEFGHNGYGNGLSHAIYIGDVRSFTLRHSYMHDALVGHDVKSRAATNNIFYNWIGGTGAGSESYEINLPDGGTTYIIGNVIRQDPTSQNTSIVDWGSENNGGANPSSGFYFINNTVINDSGTGSSYVRMLGGTYPSDVRIQNNIFAGSGAAKPIFSGPAATTSNNLNVANPGFVNPVAFDYRLTSSATAAINQGITLGTANGVSLVPIYQYVATASREARPVVGAIDLGAFEFGSAPPNQPPTVATSAAASPSSVTGLTTGLSVLGADDGGEANLTYTWAATAAPAGATPSFSVNGSNAAKNSTVTFDRAGSYTFQVTIRDAVNQTVTSSVNVVVNQTLTSIVVTPGSVTLGSSATQQFTASGRDQFGITLTTQPAFTWSLSSGIGSVSGTGLYTAPAAGSGVATVRAASGSVSATASVTVQDTTGVPAFQQGTGTNGLVAMEAEHFHANTPQGAHSWVVNTTASGSSGGSAMQAMPNNGTVINTGYVATSPRLDFRVNFVRTGVHYVWIRGRGPTNGDTVHVGLDGTAVASADRIQLSNGGFGWSRSTMDGVTARINVATTGVHIINLWMREDGAIVDKVLLTSNNNYTPTGKGPAESASGVSLVAAYMAAVRRRNGSW